MTIIRNALIAIVIVASQSVSANEISITESATITALMFRADRFRDSFAELMLNAVSDNPVGPEVQCLSGVLQQVDHFVNTLNFAGTLMNLSARMVDKADEKALLTSLQHRLNDVMSDASLTRNGARKYATGLCPTSIAAAAKLEEFNHLIYAAVETLQPFVIRVESAARAPDAPRR